MSSLRVAFVTGFTAVTLAGVSSARGNGIAYDALTTITPPTTITQSSANWIGEDVALTPGSSLNLNSIDIRTRMGASASQATFTGYLRVAIFSSETVFPSGIRPGTALWQGDISATWTRGQDLTLTAALGGMQLNTTTFWIGWCFVNSGGAVINNSTANGLWVQQNTLGPSVGLTASGYATSPNGTSWITQSGGATQAFALRVNVLPSPGALVVLGLAGVMAARRRR